jgi:hypothetical protein
MTHDEYCRTAHPKFVINYTFDVSIDGDGGQSFPPITLFRRTFTDVREAVRIARRMQRLGGGMLQGIGVLHDHEECEGLLCLNKRDEFGKEWEEDFLCYYTKPEDADQYFLDGVAHRMGTE